MQGQGNPASGTEELAHADCDLGRIAGVHVAEDKSVVRRVGGRITHGVEIISDGLVRVVHPDDLVARASLVLLLRGPGGKDLSANEHDETEGDNGAEVEPGANHPGAVLVDLQALDVDIGHEHAVNYKHGRQADICLNRKVAPEGMVGDYQSAHEAAKAEENDEVSGNAVPDHDFVTNDRDELKDCQEAGRKDARKVKSNARLGGREVGVPVALARGGTVNALRSRRSIAEDTPNGQVLQASKHKAEESAVEDEEEDEVVALFEADGIVDLASHAHEAVRRRTFDGTHCKKHKK